MIHKIKITIQYFLYLRGTIIIIIIKAIANNIAGVRLNIYFDILVLEKKHP